MPAHPTPHFILAQAHFAFAISGITPQSYGVGL
jgi:hypothetical protein